MPARLEREELLLRRRELARRRLAAFAPPTDNKGNAPFMTLDAPHPYSKWPTSGTAVYAFEGAVGGPNHVVTNTNEPGDEITLAVVEVENGAHVVDAKWVEKLEGAPITSAQVTTTGPATLVAFWWGDAGVDGDKVATPDGGFTVIDSLGAAGALDTARFKKVGAHRRFRLGAEPLHVPGRVVARERREVDERHRLEEPGELPLLLHGAARADGRGAALDGRSGRYLGTELDLGVRYRALLHGAELTLGAELGTLRPGSALVAADGSAMGAVSGGRAMARFRF